MTDETKTIAPVGPSGPSAGTGSLASEMSDAYRQRVEHYRKEMGLAEADALARDSGGDDVARIEQTPPDQLDWWVLGRATEIDPERARAVWERALDGAREELGSGHRAARAVEANGTPWERAQFLAVLEGFLADWQPRGGIEVALVETLAQTYSTQLAWMARLTVLSTTEAQRQDREIGESGRWMPPSLDAATAIDQSAAMVDRFNRMFMRTLRSLRDLRRYSTSVVVQNVGQLNLAQSQVNLAPTETPAETRDVVCPGFGGAAILD